MINAKCPKCGENKFFVEYDGSEEKHGNTIEEIHGGLAAESGDITIRCIICGWVHKFYVGE